MPKLIIEYSEELQKQLKIAATTEGKTLKELVTELIQNYLNEQQKAKKKK